jgi:hypothetical protein
MFWISVQFVDDAVWHSAQGAIIGCKQILADGYIPWGWLQVAFFSVWMFVVLG